MKDHDIFLGDQLIAHNSKPAVRRLEPALWLWWNTGNNGVANWPNVTMPSSYDVATQTITANANVAIPTPGVLDRNNYAGIDASKPFGSPTAVANGVQVGDRLVWVRSTFGNSWDGVYEVVDAGEAGVRPWKLQRTDDFRTQEHFVAPFRIDIIDPANPLWVSAAEVIGEGLLTSESNPLENAQLHFAVELGRLANGASGFRSVAVNEGFALGVQCRALGVRSYAIGNNVVVKDSVAALAYFGSGAFARKGIYSESGTAFNSFRMDEAYIIRTTSASAVTATIPTAATADTWYTGAQLEVLQAGNGIVTIVGAAGVTVTGQTSTNGIGSRLIAIYVSTNLWEVTCIPAPSALATAAQGAKAELAEIVIACSDETTDLAAGTGVVTFRMPYAMTVTAVRASVNTAPTGSTLIVDINEGGVSILGTKLSIDATEKTSTTAAVPATITDSALADDAEVSIDITQVGATVAGAGLKVTLIGTRA